MKYKTLLAPQVHICYCTHHYNQYKVETASSCYDPRCLASGNKEG